MVKSEYIENFDTSFICYPHNGLLEIPASLIKASPIICLMSLGNEPTIQLTPLSFLSLLPLSREKKKMHMIYRKSIYSQTKFHFFSLLSPHLILRYGVSVMNTFGSSLRRSLNINNLLKIKIMPQLDGENVAMRCKPLLPAE